MVGFKHLWLCWTGPLGAIGLTTLCKRHRIYWTVDVVGPNHAHVIAI